MKIGQQPDKPPASQRFIRAAQACRSRHQDVSPLGFYMLVAATLADGVDDATWDTALGVAIATRLDPSALSRNDPQTRPAAGLPDSPPVEPGPATGRPHGHLALVKASSAGGKPGRRSTGDHEGEVALYPQQICAAPSEYLPPPYACVVPKADCDGVHHRFSPLEPAAVLTPVES